MGCIYLVRHKGISPVKIGYTTSEIPTKRLEAMNTYSPYGVEIVGWFNHPKAAEIEKEIHKKYAPFRMKGEWFNITDEMAKGIINTYDETFFDRAQRALLAQTCDEYNTNDDIERVRNTFAGKKIRLSDLNKYVAKHFGKNDYTFGKEWVTRHLLPKSWCNKIEEPYSKGRGRKGEVVVIG